MVQPLAFPNPDGTRLVGSMTINVSARSLVPTTLNLGSGKDYREDCFNVDIDATWFPDAVVDLGTIDVAAGSPMLPTQRFGDIELRPASFDRIIANDVLEHVPNLMRLMTNCLALLKAGGVLEISVPYDLSCGAWQDPTHVRAFNERSWLYYTDWFWYMGWAESRFALERLQFEPSDIGKRLQSQMPLGELIRMPRTVDSMSVALRKVALTADDQKTWEHWRERKRLAERQRGTLAAGPAGLTLPGPVPSTGRPQAFAGGWGAHADRHCIWIVSPDGYIHARAFDECAGALSEAFTELGGSAPLVRHPEAWNGRLPIVFGAHLLPADAALPAGSILVNFEQVSAAQGWIGEDYLALLGRFAVLDYSRRNRDALVGRGVRHADLLEIGFADGLATIADRQIKDIDVLFYGSMNPRRARVIDGLRARGLNVVTLFGTYGAERDATIARAKVVLNLHFYDSAIFEVVRVSYLMANGCCVVSEGDEEDDDVEPFREGLVLSGYESLVERCAALVADEAERLRIGRLGQERMRARRQSALLRDLIGA